MMTPVRRDLPSGTVTFLFTDVEGSTKLLRELGAEGYAQALAEHRRVIREACAHYDGVEVDTQGDAFFFAFPTAPGALSAADEMTEALASGSIRVRIGLHTGTPLLTDEGYVGGDVHRVARIAAAGHGGQVLVSASSAALIPSDKVSQGLELRDLGEHRFKDLSAPERVYQFGDGEFPALKSLYRTNLPVPSTPFLGREGELAEVLSLLSREDTRLLTLTGPGGTGKTRLAAQAAGLASDSYPDGVWWVPLAALRDPELVLETAGQTLGAKDGLAEHIADRSLLLLLDNFEQVVEAAGDVAGLMSSCPNVDVLVTSREPLHVTGEQEYLVPPLVHEEGVGFFLARARAVRPDFSADDAVSEICRRLDDLPLALELAAARVKALSSAQILERLRQRLPLLTGGARDLPERQRTLQATIEWSYELLTPEERRLFARLAVFSGGCTLEAAEEVAEADLDTLQSLVDKSLLRHTEERFWMLETIREFASERLEAAGEAEDLQRRHAEHYLALAEEAEPHLRGSPKEWLDRLEQEHDNLRAAFDELETSGEGKAVQRIAGALWRFWTMRGYAPEGRRRLESAIRADERQTVARGKALNGATIMALETGDYGTARLRAEEALELHRGIGDVWGTAISVQLLGNVHADERDFESARQLFEEALGMFRSLGDDHYVLLAIRLLAWMHYELGDRARARSLHEEVVRRASATGNERMQATSLGALGEYALYEGRIEDALPLLAESSRIYRDVGERPELVVNLWRFARALAITERPGEAARVFSAAEALREEIGASPYRWMEEINEDTLAAIRAQLDEAAFAEAWEQGRTLTVDQAVALALDSQD
jgi:predicted ATPase/class 3 adenylate cyclase